MKKRTSTTTSLVVTATILAGASVLASRQTMNPVIVDAVKCGLGQIKCDKPIIEPGFAASIAEINMVVAGPVGRAFMAARDAKKKLMPFAPENLSPEILAPTITVQARWERKKMTDNPSVEHIVILPDGKKDQAIQPATIEAWDYDAKNLVGAVVTRLGKSATFDLSKLPAGDIDILVISKGAVDYREHIDAKKRARYGF